LTGNLVLQTFDLVPELLILSLEFFLLRINDAIFIKSKISGINLRAVTLQKNLKIKQKSIFSVAMLGFKNSGDQFYIYTGIQSINDTTFTHKRKLVT
jgi:hypothetical protein